MKDPGEKAARSLTLIRERKPLIHNITNFVVMNYTANALLALGASPVMAHAENEVEEMVAHAGALVLNIGTLSEAWIASMIRAGAEATRRKIPVILDPVGSGATSYRTKTAKTIIEKIRVSVVRGNASEIISLQEKGTLTKGVDAVHSVKEAAKTAGDLAEALDTTVAITGPTDLVTDGNRTLQIFNGHPLMSFVTGTGCTATAIIGAFLAVDEDPVTATACALAYFGLAGEMAGKESKGPGSFMIDLLNALYTIAPEDLQKGAKINKA